MKLHLYLLLALVLNSTSAFSAKNVPDEVKQATEFLNSKIAYTDNEKDSTKFTVKRCDITMGTCAAHGKFCGSSKVSATKLDFEASRRDMDITGLYAFDLNCKDLKKCADDNGHPGTGLRVNMREGGDSETFASSLRTLIKHCASSAGSGTAKLLDQRASNRKLEKAEWIKNDLAQAAAQSANDIVILKEVMEGEYRVYYLSCHGRAHTLKKGAGGIIYGSSLRNTTNFDAAAGDVCRR